MSTGTIITAVGREEPELLSRLGASVNTLAKNSPDWELDWVLALDGQVNRDVALAALEEVCPLVSITILPSVGERTGPGPTRNRALVVATGTWLLTIDSDDEYGAGMSSILDEASESNPVWVAGWAYDVDSNNHTLWKGPYERLPKSAEKNAFLDFRLKNGFFPFSCTATVVLTDAVREVGGWSGQGELYHSEDTAMWSAISARYPGVFLDDVATGGPALLWRKHADSLTASDEWNQGSEVLEAIVDYAESKAHVL